MLASISVGTSRKGGPAGGEAIAPIGEGIPKPYPKKRTAQIREAMSCAWVANKLLESRGTDVCRVAMER
jgi:hypothetical protein